MLADVVGPAERLLRATLSCGVIREGLPDICRTALRFLNPAFRC
jgi:hypothetical protein